jgi:hypothetical protein
VIKLVVAGAIVVAFAAYILHPHGASAAKVATCLEKHGATARPSTFFEDAFGISADGQQVPDGLKSQLENVKKHLFDVTVGDDSGLLMDTQRERQDTRLMAMAAAQGFDITPQSHGKVVMLWFGGPTVESQSVVEDCF